MRASDFIYYSARCAKHRSMASSTGCEQAFLLHQRLARSYADKATSALNQLLCPR